MKICGICLRDENETAFNSYQKNICKECHSKRAKKNYEDKKNNPYRKTIGKRYKGHQKLN